jgi:hypothetical protein
MSADRGQLLPIIDELAARLEPEPGIAPRQAAIGAPITRYPDAGATEVLLSPLLGTTFDDASRAAGAPA